MQQRDEYESDLLRFNYIYTQNKQNQATNKELDFDEEFFRLLRVDGFKDIKTFLFYKKDFIKLGNELAKTSNEYT